MTARMVSIKSIFKIKDTDETIVTEHDKLFLILRRDSESAVTYNSFDSQLNIYLNKLTGKNVDIVKLLVNKKVVHIGTNPKKTANTLGTITYHTNKLMFIILDSSALDIDLLDGTIGNIEEVVNTIYYQFVRFIALTNKPLKINDKLNELIIKYYTFLLLKVLKLSSLNDKSLELVKYITGLMYYKCFLNLNITLASEKTLRILDPKYITEFESAIDLKLVEKYMDIKDILKLLIDFKVVTATPNELTYNLLMGLRTTSFLSVTVSYDLLLAGIINGLYSQDFYRHLFINKQIQTQVEVIVSQYYDNVKYEKIDGLILTSVSKDVEPA